jgi:PAS domain S-box-containing protein
MKSFKNWKVLTKLSVPYLVIFVVLIFDFISLYVYMFSIDNNARAMTVAGKNRMLLQKSVYTVELVARANKNKHNELDEIIKTIDKNLLVFDKGGYVAEFKEPLEPLPEELKYILLAVREQWEPFKNNVNILLDAQLVTYQKRVTVEVSDSTDQSASISSFITELSAQATEAVNYVETYSDPLFFEFDKLLIEIIRLEEKENQKSFLMTFFLLILNLIIIVLAIYFGNRSIVKPIKYLADKSKLLAKGNFQTKIDLQCDNSIGEIATNLELLKLSLSEKTVYVNELISDNYTYEFAVKNDNDKLGLALINFRDSLIAKSKEDINRKLKEAKQNWLTQKLAEFGEILRIDNDEIGQFSFNLIKYIVNSLDSNQGGIFLLNEENKSDIHIELVASIAFDKRKYLQKRIEMGEGLVGRVILEKKSIYMKMVPEDYIQITSGLGGSRPRNIILVPLLLNNEVFGVIEIASFTELEEHQIEFLNKAGQSIASTLASVKTGIRTSKLLKESQEQRLTLAKKEEEMTLNMNALKKVQAEAKIQEEALSSFTDSVNHTLIRAEFNTSGVLVYANTKFLHKLEYTSNLDIEGREIFSFIDVNDLEEFRKMWATIAAGGSHFEGRIKHVTKRDNEIWMIATYTAVRNKNGDVEKILFLGIDVTEEEIRNLDYKGQISALDISNIKVEISPSGIIQHTNELFRQAVGYSEVQLETKTIFDFIPKQEITLFKLNWDRVLANEIYQGEIRIMKENAEDAWIFATFAPVLDIYGKVSKIIILATNISERKFMEIKAKEDSRKILEQAEELTQNLEEVQAIRDELEKKNALYEANNLKLANSEGILKKALEKSKENERIIVEKTRSLESSEEEIRQNMEELMATQEELENQKKSLEDKNSRMKKNEEVLKKMLEKAKEKEKEYAKKEEELNELIAENQKLKELIKKYDEDRKK